MLLPKCKAGELVRRFNFLIVKFTFVTENLTSFFLKTAMEDAHTTKLDIKPGMSFFGVFDGHGGKFQFLD